MNATSTFRSNVAIAAAWIAAYIAASAYAVSFIAHEDEVALFWPASGLALAMVLRHGLRWAWLVPAALLLVHLTISPVSVRFLPWSLAANFLGVLAGGWAATRGAELQRGLVRDGLQVVVGGVSMALVSGLFGSAGMWYAGMVATPQLDDTLLRWVLGDLLGVLSVTPVVMLALRRLGRPPQSARPEHVGESLLWNIALFASFLLMAWGMSASSAYALGLSALPLTVMLWSALRFSPLRTAISVLLTVLLLGGFAGLGLAGFRASQPTLEVAILLMYLCLIAVLPMVLALTVSEHRAAVRRLLLRASTDPLSGLPNRGAFEAQVRQALLDPASTPLALAYLDLDNLKLVNDTASHRAGDALIVAVANALRTQMQPGDLLAHLGGDEFVVLLHNASPAIARERAQALLRTVENSHCRFGEEDFGTTTSIGLMQFNPEQTEFAVALSQADAACFKAKELGGDRVCVAGSADADPTSTMRWTVRIREALQHDDFLLYAQSIAPLHASNDEGLHFELLLRMRDARGGAVHTPDRFIPAAERFQLASRIDRKVVRMALDWLESHPKFTEQVAMCSINLSAGTVLDDGFVGFIAERLQRSAVPADRICFEITETSAMRDPARAQRVIDALRGLGCRFALDDFGTGFCSFSQLRSLDVDFIKIDGSFVREVQTSPLATEVVSSITRIAHLLHKRTIAEHTETDAVRAVLAAMGVDYAQGYAIDRPQPLEAYAAAMAPASIRA
jgi:diguanylate cyclase (GGDEF)-like protein